MTDILSGEVGNILDRDPGNCLLLYGPRGNGKTVLLATARDQAAKKAKVCELVEVAAEDGASWQLLGVPEQADETTKTLSASVAGLKGGIEKKSTAPGTIVARLHSVVESGPTLLLVDEAHCLPPGLGRVLLNAIQRCLRDGFPLLAILAGTPDLPESLRKMNASFWERITDFGISRLESDEDVRQALRIPAEQSGFPIDDDALELLVRESQRYPFFIQLVGSVAWRESSVRGNEPRRITLADAERGVLVANQKRERFYEARRKEIVEHQVLAVAEEISRLMLEQDDGRLDWRTVKDRLAAPDDDDPINPTWGDYKRHLEKLEELGLIWSVRVGVWEAGIPSLCQYLLDQTGR